METNNNTESNNDIKKPMENPDLLKLQQQLNEYLLQKVPEHTVLDHFMLTDTNLLIRMNALEEQMKKTQGLVDTLCILIGKLLGSTGEGSSAVTPAEVPEQPNPPSQAQSEVPVNKVQIATPAEALNNMLSMRRNANQPPPPHQSSSNQPTMPKR